MKRALEYTAFLLIVALITPASLASASYVTRILGGWRPLGIFTEPEQKLAGEGAIFTAEGDVVGNHCYFVRVPGEGILYEGVLYFYPQNPDTTACVHLQGAAADISLDARSGTSANCLAHEAFRTVSRNCLKVPRDAFIDYLFHLPSMVAALILAYCFFSLLWERSGSGHL